MFATIFALVAFSAVLIFVSYSFRHKGSSPEFHIAGRHVGVLQIAASTFTLIGGGEFVTLTALTFMFGPISMVFFLGVGLGFIVLALLSRKARLGADAGDFHSLPDFFHARFGRGASILATLLSIVALGALLVIQLLVGGMMLASVTGLPAWSFTVGMAVVVCIYVCVGGFHGVLTTDVVQAIVMFLVVGIAAVAYGLIPGAATTQPAKPDAMPIGFGLLLTVAGFMAVLGGADVWQRVLAARDDSVARRGLLTNAAAWVAFGAIFVVLALKIRTNFPQAAPGEAFFAMLQGGLPEWLSAMVALLLFSALLSTADTELFVISVIVNKELSRHPDGHPLATKTTRILIAGVTAVATVLAIVATRLLDVYFVLLYLLMVLGPISLARLLGRGNRLLAIIGMAGGTATVVALAIANKLESEWWPLLIIVLPALSLLPKASDAPTAAPAPSEAGKD